MGGRQLGQPSNNALDLVIPVISNKHDESVLMMKEHLFTALAIYDGGIANDQE